MRNMLCLPWTSVGLSKRVLFLAFVAGAALMSASTSSLAQQHDHSRQIKLAGVSATFTAWFKGEDISREKFEEIGLQFIFVVVFGGLLTARIARLRDNATRKDSELSSLRDLIKQVDELYRSTKQSKRMIRSRLRQIADGYEVDAVFFAARMEELSNTQLKLEQTRNIIRTRPELFDGEKKRRIGIEIEYSNNYLHDVVQEFEERKVSWIDECCRFSGSCEMLTDFLCESRMPAEFEADLKTMRSELSTAERYRALKSIISKTVKSGGQRHKLVSDACMLLVIREMRDIVLERLGRLSPARLVLRPRESGTFLDKATSASANDETPNKMSESGGAL
jgi:hypothetical protein